jgi:hypothetical protein
VSDTKSAIESSGYSAEDQQRLREVLAAAGYDQEGLNEGQLNEFSKARAIPLAEDYLSWPNVADKAMYLFAGIGRYTESGEWEFINERFPKVLNMKAYMLLREKGLITWDGLPRNPSVD